MNTRPLILTTVALVAAVLTLAACAASVPASADNTPSGTHAIKPAETASAASGQTFTGYLIDQKCGLTGIDIQDGTDLTKHPEKHQLSCAMMPGCLASGFGLSVQQADGTYQFYKFDAAGSQMAIDTVINKTKKADSLLVEVAGTMSGETITVSSITEK